jgi:hypothetical protein
MARPPEQGGGIKVGARSCGDDVNMTPNLQRYNDDWHSLRVKLDTEVTERDTIEENRWSFKSDGHYTVVVGEVEYLTTKAVLKGKVCVTPDVLEEYEFKTVKEMIEFDMKEDMPNTLYHEIKNWKERKITFEVKKCEHVGNNIYEILIEVEVTGEVECCEERC